MNADSDLARVLRSWLHEDDHESADRVLDLVVEQLDATPQRRATWWPARRFPPMSRSLQFVVAAAAVVAAVVIAGVVFIPRTDFGPAPSQAPSATRTPSAPPPLGERLPVGPLDPGIYFTQPFPAPANAMTISFSVPDGWQGGGDSVSLPVGTRGPDGAALGFIVVNGLFSDPCDADYSGEPEVSVGPTVDDLVSAFQDQSAYDATSPVDVTLDGYSGKQLDLVMPSDVDFIACRDGHFYIGDGLIYAQGPGNVWHLWILDVDGVRVVILAQDNPGTSAEDKAELLAMVNSISIQP